MCFLCRKSKNCQNCLICEYCHIHEYFDFWIDFPLAARVRCAPSAFLTGSAHDMLAVWMSSLRADGSVVSCGGWEPLDSNSEIDIELDLMLRSLGNGGSPRSNSRCLSSVMFAACGFGCLWPGGPWLLRAVDDLFTAVEAGI